MKRFATRTGQLWRYRMERVLLAAALLANVALFSLLSGNPVRLPEGATVALYFPIVFAWFIWKAIAIRCPRCGAHPAWYEMTHGRAGSAEARIAATASCPSCGFDPSSARPGSAPS